MAVTGIGVYVGNATTSTGVIEVTGNGSYFSADHGGAVIGNAGKRQPDSGPARYGQFQWPTRRGCDGQWQRGGN